MRINLFLLLACVTAAAPCFADTTEASVQGHDADALPATYVDADPVVFVDDMFAGRQNSPATVPDQPGAGIGVPVDAGDLDRLRGGDGTVDNNVLIDGSVEGNTADRIVSGANAISEGAFTNANGINTVIQNSGSNVLIQNGMVVNVQFVAPPP